MGKFKEGNDFGKKSSRAGVPNKNNAEVKKLIAKITETGLNKLYAQIDEMDTKELIDFVTKLIPYHLPKLQSTSIDTSSDLNAVTISFNKKDNT